MPPDARRSIASTGSARVTGVDGAQRRVHVESLQHQHARYSAGCTPRGDPFTDGLRGTSTGPAAVRPDISGRARAASGTSTLLTSRIRKSDAYGFVDAICAEADTAYISIGMTTTTVRQRGEIFAIGETRYTRSATA